MLRINPNLIVGTAAEFADKNPVLTENEVAIETDTGTFKVGTTDGVHYNSANLCPTRQLAAKPAEATPTVGSSTGGPGIYALASEAVEDGGWMTASIDDNGADLVASAHDGSKALAEVRASEDTDTLGGYTSYVFALTQSDDAAKHSGAQMYSQTAPDGSATEGYVAVGPYGTLGEDGGAALVATQGVVFLNIIGGPSQVGLNNNLVTVRLGDSDSDKMLFAVDPGGPIVFDSNGDGHRIKVSTGGVLSTEAV